MTERPTFNPTGLPAAIRARAISHAANSWCYVTAEGFPYFGLTEEKARRMLAHKPDGATYPPCGTAA